MASCATSVGVDLVRTGACGEREATVASGQARVGLMPLPVQLGNSMHVPTLATGSGAAGQLIPATSTMVGVSDKALVPFRGRLHHLLGFHFTQCTTVGTGAADRALVPQSCHAMCAFGQTHRHACHP